MSSNQESPLFGLNGGDDRAVAEGNSIYSPRVVPSDEQVPLSQADDDEDQTDLTADIIPAIPVARTSGLHVPGANGRISVAELEGRHVHQGLHPGDKFVRRARPTEEGFRRVG